MANDRLTEFRRRINIDPRMHITPEGEPYLLTQSLAAWARGIEHDLERIDILSPYVDFEIDDPITPLEETCWRLDSAVDKLTYLTALCVSVAVLETGRTQRGERRLRLRRVRKVRDDLVARLGELGDTCEAAARLCTFLTEWPESRASQLRNAVAHEMAAFGGNLALAPFEQKLVSGSGQESHDVMFLAPADSHLDPAQDARAQWGDLIDSVRQSAAVLEAMLECMESVVAKQGPKVPVFSVTVRIRASGRPVIE
jgi:hypothetical protein